MRIAFFGSSLLSSYWNGAATYYRGLLRALAAHGHAITFFEPNAYDRPLHCDIELPDWACVQVFEPDAAAMAAALRQAAGAEIVIKASGVGVLDDELLAGIMAHEHAVRVFWDVDAPATLAAIRSGAAETLRRALRSLDLVMTYGGGPPVVDAYTALGAPACHPIYNALDPDTHFPVPPDPALAADLLFLANRMPDRESRAEEFFFRPARLLPERNFLLGGLGWHDRDMAASVRRLGHVGTDRHNVLNSSVMAVLNVARDSMAAVGFSPATRVFEAAGAAACIITDAWEGIEMFLQPGEEILVARDGDEVVRLLRALTPERARGIGLRARRRVLADHTYRARAAIVDAVFRAAHADKRQFASA